MDKKQDGKERAKKILDILKREFPGARTALGFSTPLQLLIATMLSAQCTDERVNMTTPALFKKYRDARDYAGAPLYELEGYVRSINFFRNKAKSIKACCRKIVEEFKGRLPKTVEELTTLPGVGRKTANVVLASAFSVPALAVDTHVKRVAGRLGLTVSDDPDDIEKDLCAIIPEKRWAETTSLLILHGRRTCRAKTPLCEACPVRAHCDYYGTIKGKTNR
ncbi:MAG: endonuclease III [Deltaproteobacteria bacterium]|nr:endonuclease III [Deltaproteobacteria bacterium]